jgi:hypothetical protein
MFCIQFFLLCLTVVAHLLCELHVPIVGPCPKKMCLMAQIVYHICAFLKLGKKNVSFISNARVTARQSKFFELLSEPKPKILL